MAKNLVLITSVICVPPSPLSYAPNRSAFSSDERYEQTLRTIQSCKERISNAHVVVLEGSDALDARYAQGLCEAADEVVTDLAQKAGAALAQSPYKAMFESFKLMTYLQDHEDQWSEWANVFKISGRYALTGDFQASLWESPSKPIALRRLLHNGYSTVFFRVAGGTHPLLRFVEDLEAGMPRLNAGTSFEYTLFRASFTEADIQFIETIGIEGTISIQRHAHIVY